MKLDHVLPTTVQWGAVCVSIIPNKSFIMISIQYSISN